MVCIKFVRNICTLDVTGGGGGDIGLCMGKLVFKLERWIGGASLRNQFPRLFYIFHQKEATICDLSAFEGGVSR